MSKVNLDTFNEAIKPIFDKVGITKFSFTYWPEVNEIILDQSFTQNDEFIHKIVVKLNEDQTKGTIYTGCVFENEFFDDETLGWVEFRNNAWTIVK